MADPGEGPGGAAPQLFLDQTGARRAEIVVFFFADRIQKRHLHAHVWKHNERPEPQAKKVVAASI